MRVVILQSSYWPWRGYFDLIHDADRFVFYDDVQFTRQDWRSRNRLYGANGVFWLSVPAPRKAVRGTIREVVLPDPHWQAKHYRAIATTYRGAPAFGELDEFLRETYLERTWTSLMQLNRHCIRFVARGLGCATELLDSRDLTTPESDSSGVGSSGDGSSGDRSSGDGSSGDGAADRVERLARIVERVGGTEYLSGPAARDYLDGHEDAFAARGLALRFKTYDYPSYPQRREPFEPQVSILDLIAHVGFAAAPDFIWRPRARSPAA